MSTLPTTEERDEVLDWSVKQHKQKDWPVQVEQLKPVEAPVSEDEELTGTAS